MAVGARPGEDPGRTRRGLVPERPFTCRIWPEDHFTVIHRPIGHSATELRLHKRAGIGRGRAVRRSPAASIFSAASVTSF
jgi:hypothetical protein